MVSTERKKSLDIKGGNLFLRASESGANIKLGRRRRQIIFRQRGELEQGSASGSFLCFRLQHHVALRLDVKVSPK